MESAPRAAGSPLQRQPSTRRLESGRNCFQRLTADGPQNRLQPVEENNRRSNTHLGISNLDRDAGFAQWNVLYFPRCVHFAFGIGIGRVAIAKFDGVGGVEIAGLHALPFNPYIFDAWNFGRHVLDSVEGSLLVCIRGGWIPFQFDDMEYGFRLTEAVLASNITAGKKRQRQKGSGQNFRGACDVDSHGCPRSILE
jgi:hypothetical protein